MMIRNDLSWGPNTEYFAQKLWCLRGLKKLCADTSDLLDVNTKQVGGKLKL